MSWTCENCVIEYDDSVERCELCGRKRRAKAVQTPKPPAQKPVATLYLREVEAEIRRGSAGICIQKGDEPHYIGEPVPVTPDKVFGRNDLPQDGNRYRYISEAHCRFSHEDGTWYIEDAGSKNHTLLNSRRLTPGEKKELRDNSKLQLADKLFYPQRELKQPC